MIPTQALPARKLSRPTEAVLECPAPGSEAPSDRPPTPDLSSPSPAVQQRKRNEGRDAFTVADDDVTEVTIDPTRAASSMTGPPQSQDDAPISAAESAPTGWRG